MMDQTLHLPVVVAVLQVPQVVAAAVVMILHQDHLPAHKKKVGVTAVNHG